MTKISRRELLRRAGAGAGMATLGGFAFKDGMAIPLNESATSFRPQYEWIRSTRLLIAEGYCPPFYPSLEYDPEQALAIARRLNCNAFRYPTYSYVSFFPTKTSLPRHPELGTRDPFARTVGLFHRAGLKVVAYNPLNHPFMDVRASNPEYSDWSRKGLDGKPYITRHLGWTQFYEGCLNSPLHDQVKRRVREVVTNYPVDLMYFDGPYQGMDQRRHYCQCSYCRAAYQKARGKSIPRQDGEDSLEDIAQYEDWLTEDVVLAFMHEICDMVRQVRDVPIVYNDTGLLNHDVRSRAYRYTDGFMFEAADTPEEKLFNMRVGQSTGNIIWTYLSSHTEYNCEHLRDKTVRGWYSCSVEGERLKLDGAVATAAGVGYCYWGLNRVWYSPEDIWNEPSLRGMKDIFDFAQKNEELLHSVRPVPDAGILVGTQTSRWYESEKFVRQAYRNYFYGAHQLLKDLSYDAEPFLDFEVTPERLAKYRLVYVPNVPCLSDAQCTMLTDYVEHGGTLLATHLTSVADELGRPRHDYGLKDLFGATLQSPEPTEIPDLYLRLLPSRKLIPQDPQVMLFQVDPSRGAKVMAETYERGYHRTLGPAVITRRYGQGQVIYIGSGLEAVYVETLNESIRTYFHSLLDPILAPDRTHEVEHRPGLMCQFTSSPKTLILHMVANTGNIWKKHLVQESFLPIQNVRVRLRVPAGRRAQSATLMWSGSPLPCKVENGWIQLTVPQVLVYEALRVNLD